MPSDDDATTADAREAETDALVARVDMALSLIHI